MVGDVEQPRDASARAFLVHVSVRRWEIIAVTVIVLTALLLRTIDFTTLPGGFHGDESVVGLEAQRIQRDGYIGVYSPYAAGQPTGPLYLFAISLWIFGDTVFAVRIVPALLGTLTVLALYIILRRNFGVRVALIGSSVLAVMNWHIFFARIGFPLEAWPLVVVLTVGAISEAVRRGRWYWWLISGALTGSGIYVYNAHPAVVVIMLVFLAGYLILAHKRSIRQELAGIALFVAACIVVLIPMIRFATADDTYYWKHFDRARVTETEEWQALDGPVDQARWVISNYRRIWERLSWGPELDIVDGTGLTTLVPSLMLVLAAIGILFGLWRYRNAEVFLGVLIIFLIPLATEFSIGGETRRTLIMTPFIAMFCALACVGIIDLVKARGRYLRHASILIVACLLGIVAYQNLRLYFHDFAAPEIQNRILAKSIADTAKFLDDLPYDPYVYHYSDTWSIHYETVQFLAPDVTGEDRSERFGEFDFDIDIGDTGGRCPLFVFLGSYKDDIDEVRQLYPGREITPDDFALGPTFRVYQPQLDDGLSCGQHTRQGNGD